MVTQRTTLHTSTQNLIELWVVATRPVENNGLGMSVVDTALEVAQIQSMFHLIRETPSTFAVWQQIVLDGRVHGKLAHDARIVALMVVEGIGSILTFDDDFKRFPQVSAVDPASV